MTEAATIVVIEDDAQIRRLVESALQEAGLQVHSAADGRHGLVEIGTRQPDAVILDIGLPDITGIEVIQQTRNWSSVPIIVLSARTQEQEKVEALDAGADDYLTKPFGIPELLARLRAQLRRGALAQGSSPDGVFQFGAVSVDLPRRLVTRDAVAVHLTPLEFRLLATLIRNSGRVVTQRQLLKEVWGPAYVDNGHYLRIYMGNLRRKLEADAAQPKHLITETGVGYRLVG